MTVTQSSVDSATSATGWQGKLQLIYNHNTRGTQVSHCQTQAPLRMQRSFYPEGPEICHSTLLHTAGGIVGGDRLSLDIQLRPNSHVVLTTAAANKIYRSNGLIAQQEIQICVEPEAILEWLPQESIVFNQALYRQKLRIDLSPGAHWLGWDITRFGRSARGETFIEGDWRSQTQVWQQGRPLWIDQQWLPGHPEILESPHGLAGCSVVGSFVWIGQDVTTDWVTQARALQQGKGTLGVTRIQHGLLCRYRGHSSLEARQWFTQVWNLIRGWIGKRPACLPRVWQIF
ncbi:MAG: urease accessory protein UreD [Thermosynechococcaceae cyanobacterium]